MKALKIFLGLAIPFVCFVFFNLDRLVGPSGGGEIVLVIAVALALAFLAYFTYSNRTNFEEVLNGKLEFVSRILFRRGASSNTNAERR